MGLLDFLAEIRATRELEELSRRIARHTYTPLRQTAFARVARMTQAEARGYLWAKAGPLVLAEVAALAGSRRGLAEWAQLLLAERARQRVVRNVLSDVVRDRAWITLRRAA